MHTLLKLALAATLLLPPAVHAQDDYTAIEKRLTPAQLQATGLERLTTQELALLNQLLRDERDTVLQAADARSQHDRSPGLFERRAVEPIRSTIKGSMREWSVGTRFELENGQRWRVTQGSLYTSTLSQPKVTIAPGALGSWYLQVEGHSPRLKVQRVD
ncbi:hypothetical protein ACFQZQ_12035 [Lysobacter koreensis]|uniref:Secreted protein n=1 Tax=Lysobacter koreensis TaxID=266122 RepID=A0ABW2YQR5_9GAMM